MALARLNACMGWGACTVFIVGILRAIEPSYQPCIEWKPLQVKGACPQFPTERSLTLREEQGYTAHFKREPNYGISTRSSPSYCSEERQWDTSKRITEQKVNKGLWISNSVCNNLPCTLYSCWWMIEVISEMRQVGV